MFYNCLDLDRYITNLSSRTLTDTQKSVLSLGLKFIPVSRSKPETVPEAFGRFERLNRLRHFFRDSEPSEPHPFRPRSAWIPPRASEEIELYLQRVSEELHELTLQPRKIVPNLSLPQKRALKDLATDTTLVIKNADKGSGIVVEDRDKYIRDGLSHLSDANIYREIESDPTDQLAQAINTLTQSLFRDGTIDATTSDYLKFPTTKMPRTQQMYFLKKIHKSPTAVRPICSECGGPTEKVSRLIDLHLQPHVSNITSYIKDSGHLIKLIENTKLPPNCTLGTIDIKSMYTNTA